MRFTIPQLVSMLAIVLALLVWLYPSYYDLAVMYELAGMPSDSIAYYEKYLESHPEDEKSRRSLANLHIYMGDVDAAIADFEKIKEANPGDLSARRNLIQIYYDAMDYDMVIAERESLVEWLEQQLRDQQLHKRPGDAKYERMLWEEYDALVGYYMFQGNADKTVELRYKMMQAAPLDPEIMREYVDTLLFFQVHDRFLRTAREIANLFPDDKDLGQKAMSIALYLRNYQRVIELADIFEEKNPKDWDLWYYELRARRMAALADPTLWGNYVTRVLDAYDLFGDQVSVYDIIIETMDRNEMELARTALERWRNSAVSRRDAWDMLLYSYLERAKTPKEEAYKLFVQAMQLFPGDNNLKIDVGWMAMDLAHFRDAADIWRQLLRTDPKNVDYHAALLEALQGLEDGGEYTAAIGQAILMFPERKELRETLGWYYQDKEDWLVAADQWGQLWQAEPENEQYFENYIHCISQAKDPEALEKALKEHPEWAGLREKLAMMQQDSTAWVEAAESWKKLWTANPRNSDYYQNYIFCLVQMQDELAYEDAIMAVQPTFAEDQVQIAK